MLLWSREGKHSLGTIWSSYVYIGSDLSTVTRDRHEQKHCMCMAQKYDMAGSCVTQEKHTRFHRLCKAFIHESNLCSYRRPNCIMLRWCLLLLHCKHAVTVHDTRLNLTHNRTRHTYNLLAHYHSCSCCQSLLRAHHPARDYAASMPYLQCHVLVLPLQRHIVRLLLRGTAVGTSPFLPLAA